MNFNLIKVFKLKTQYIAIKQTLSYSTINNRIKTIELKTCGQLFDKLREKEPKLYGKSPSNGLSVKVEYVDTFRGNKSDIKTKTIVAIHGIPGYHNHFNELIDYFAAKQSVRVIVPNLPDFELTRQTMSFWHSNQERSQLIRDFLRAINVKQIDCLICHSAGIHPSSLLWTNPEGLIVKSLAIFSPPPLRMLKSSYPFVEVFGILTKTRLGIKIMEALKIHLLPQKFGFKSVYENINEFLLAVLLILNSDNTYLGEKLEAIIVKGIPTVIVIGEKDRVVPKSNFSDILKLLKLNQNSIKCYNPETESQYIAINDNLAKVLLFKNGGHFAYNKYHDIVNEQINNLINHLQY